MSAPLIFGKTNIFGKTKTGGRTNAAESPKPVERKNSVTVGRRAFLQTGAALGGGLLVSMYVPLAVKAGTALTAAEKNEFAVNAFVHIGSDESVMVISAHSEMGQGIYTSLPMLLNEELEADWARVRVEAAPVDAVYNHPVFGIQMTGGSTTSPSEWVRYRKMGALARTMLVQAAGQKWNVPVGECTVVKGVVFHDASHRRATYGELADAAAKLTPPADVKLKEAKEFTLIGKSTLRLDTPSKVNGTAEFGLDVHLPGMLTAVVARPPVFGGKVVKVDASEAMKIAGVKTVEQVPSGVAVIAEGFWPAKLGRDKLHIEWDLGANANLSSEQMFREFAETGKKPGLIAKKGGDPVAALGGAAKTITAEYDVPYLAHCMMEPLNCVVDLRADSCEIWTGTQFQTGDCAAAAKTAGLPFNKVQIHTTLLGGGFGRRANPASDFVVEAVEVAKVAKAPVKVVWTREDDLKGGSYRPMWHDRFAAGLDASGNPVAWTHTIVGQSIMQGTPFEAFGIKDGIDSASVEGAADILYGIPNF